MTRGVLFDPTGELDFDEFRKAIRRHGRMSVRSVTDNELKEVFAVVDKDSGGTVSAVSSHKHSLLHFFFCCCRGEGNLGRGLVAMSRRF